jgi:hypothetical protein
MIGTLEIELYIFWNITKKSEEAISFAGRRVLPFEDNEMNALVTKPIDLERFFQTMSECFADAEEHK